MRRSRIVPLSHPLRESLPIQMHDPCVKAKGALVWQQWLAIALAGLAKTPLDQEQHDGHCKDPSRKECQVAIACGNPGNKAQRDPLVAAVNRSKDDH